MKKRFSEEQIIPGAVRWPRPPVILVGKRHPGEQFVRALQRSLYRVDGKTGGEPSPRSRKSTDTAECRDSLAL